jgi:hypothetical protein
MTKAKMTKKTKTAANRHCAMCGAVEGLLHHDRTVGEVLVALTEHACTLPHRCDMHGRLLCQPCVQGNQELELEKAQTPEGALYRAAQAQSAFWEALSELEGELGFDVDDARDLEGLTVEDLKAEQDEDEDEDEDDDDEDDCTCADRSWYGPEHDSACPLAGRPRA